MIEQDKNTIYIVSGIMRSGSSMIMKALIEGGMDAAYDPNRDKANNADTEYKGETYVVNPGGYFEMSPELYNRDKLDELIEQARGKLIKFLIPGVLEVSVPEDVKLKIILMLRDPDEIDKSWKVSFKDISPETYGFDLRFYGFTMKDAIDFFEEEMGADVLAVVYNKVLKNPKKEFRIIRDEGWPIRPTQAAKAIDTSLYRVKKEELEGEKRVKELWTPNKK